MYEIMTRLRRAEIGRDEAIARADRGQAAQALAEVEHALADMRAILLQRAATRHGLQVSDAEDLAQRIAVTFLRQRFRSREPAVYTAMVKRIFRSRLIDFFRAAERRRKRESSLTIELVEGLASVIDPPDPPAALVDGYKKTIEEVLGRAHALIRASSGLRDIDDKAWAFLETRVRKKPIAQLLASAPPGSRYDAIRPRGESPAAFKAFQDQVSADTGRYRQALGKLMRLDPCPLPPRDRAVLARIIVETARANE